MHPILGQFRRLALYLLAWTPIATLLALLLHMPGALGWRDVIALAVPLSLIYAFVCLSAYYSCRATALETSGLVRLLLTHLTAALVATWIWLGVARLLEVELAATPMFAGLDQRVASATPLLFGTGILLYLLSVAFYYVLLALEASREAESRALRASILARDAELRALKAQVNPHFLFNSLNSISALTASDAPKAREMCILLGDFLRRTLGLGEKAVIPFEEEMSLIHAFLAVEKIRFGARLRMQEEIEAETLALDIPPLLLQPLVENAVAHGVANLVEGGAIRLEAHSRHGQLLIVVENSYDPDAPVRRRSGVGLANVRQRLDARYGNRAAFNVAAGGGIFRVSITVPAEKEARPA